MNLNVADAEKDLKIHPVLSVQVLRKFIYLFEKKRKKNWESVTNMSGEKVTTNRTTLPAG